MRFEPGPPPSTVYASLPSAPDSTGIEFAVPNSTASTTLFGGIYS